MPSFEEKAIVRQVNYIQNKFKRVNEETGSVIALLQRCLYVFDRRVKELSENNGDGFITLYRKLNSDFEDFQEKLIYVQASIDLPSDCKHVPNEPSAVKDDSIWTSNNQEPSSQNDSTQLGQKFSAMLSLSTSQDSYQTTVQDKSISTSNNQEHSSQNDSSHSEQTFSALTLSTSHVSYQTVQDENILASNNQEHSVQNDSTQLDKKCTSMPSILSTPHDSYQTIVQDENILVSNNQEHSSQNDSTQLDQKISAIPFILSTSLDTNQTTAEGENISASNNQEHSSQSDPIQLDKNFSDVASISSTSHDTYLTSSIPYATFPKPTFSSSSTSFGPIYDASWQIKDEKENLCQSNSTQLDQNCSIVTSSLFTSCDASKTNDANCSPLFKSRTSSSSTSYASICDIAPTCAFQRNLPHVSESLSRVNTDQPQKRISSSEHSREKLTSRDESLENILMSIESLSQGSCYRSMSSDLSDLRYQSVTTHEENLENNLCIQNEPHSQCSGAKARKVISPLNITLPLITSATFTHIENPGNFWMQLESYKESILNFPKEKFHNAATLSSVMEGDFCLAPSKSVPFYYRVKVLSEAHSDAEEIKVFLIDHGSSQTVQLHELRVLPQEAYDVPMQAIHCFLAGVSAPNNIWCYAAIRKMKEFSNNSIETHIKTRICDKYAVQLIATTTMLDEEYPFDIGHVLCIDNFAIANKVSLDEDSVSTPALYEDGKIDSRQISNHISRDSGVSLTPNQRSSPFEQSSEFNFQSSECSKNVCTIQPDLISFISEEKLSGTINNTVQQPDVDPSMLNQCLKICSCKCPLHLLIPFPSINFVEEDMVVVMLSHIVNPNEFYVNMAMETCIDELLEQMSIAYNSLKSPHACSIVLDDLKEGMFLAACFEDGNWYRVKVLNVHLKFDQSPNVYVQYVDYGNKAWIKNTDLRTLTPEFAEHPAYSVKCTLAGVAPVRSTLSSSTNGEAQSWNDEAVMVFKELLDFEHCFTAQIIDRETILNNDPLYVLLWDTQGKQDVLINETFVESGMAEFDHEISHVLARKKPKKTNDIEILNHWDPMKEEYKDIQNSYGVHMDDFQVAVSGYRNNDEDYICKYYSLRGYCPRGQNCIYEHVPLAECGVTRDKESLYLFNSTPPLPDPGSYVLVQVSSVLTPSFFYVQLPFGNRTVNEFDSLINRGFTQESLRDPEVNALFHALNDQYSNKPFDENSMLALADGIIVVARRQVDQSWHRGRINSGLNLEGPYKVFFVDFGNEEWVDRRHILQIKPEFMHAPFQAIQCQISDAEPLGFEVGCKWSPQAVSCFKNLVSDTVMLAYVENRFNDVLEVSLRRTTENDHLTIKDHLIRGGFAQDLSPNTIKKQECRYIPG